MPTARERYDEMIRTAIAGILRPLDFKKRLNSFFRDTGHGWILIDFQASQFGSRDDVSFTINLGVSFSELQPPNEAAPSLGRAHVRQRVGRVIGKSSDVWWSLDAMSDLTAVAAEVTDALIREAIPWLEQRTVLGDLLAAMQLDAGSWSGGNSHDCVSSRNAPGSTVSPTIWTGCCGAKQQRNPPLLLRG